MTFWEYVISSVGSAGFLKWLWDGAQFGWRKLYRNRVTADFYVSYFAPKPGDRGREEPVEKCSLLVVRNGTDKVVVIDTFILENSWWRRWFGGSVPKNVVVEQELMKIPKNRGMQWRFGWLPGNVINPHSRYFGVHVRGQKGVVWVRKARWKQAVREYKEDFPDWADHVCPIRPLQFKRYGPVAGEPGSPTLPAPEHRQPPV